MKIKPFALRNGARILEDETDQLRTDSWHVHGIRGDRGATTALEGGVITDAVPPMISLAGGIAYTQNFDSLSNVAGSTTNNLLINGWAMTESGGGARDNEQYAVDTGASNTGDTFSYGAAAAADRALGGLRSGTLIPIFGAAFTNGSGSTITELAISYFGEQWRLGTAGRTDRLDFQISFDATDLTTGTWIDIDSLDFTTPNTVTVGAKDGNAAENRTALSHTITDLTIANGATFWIRWIDLDASGADDGLAVDDFSITATAGPSLPALSIDDVTLAEGDAGTVTYTFTVSLSAPAGPGGVTFDIATADGTATVADGDYVANTLTSQTIPEGSSTYTFSVTVNGDTVFEPNETFFVNITSVTGATVADGQGQGTILNDDAPPPVPGTLFIDDVTLAEGDGGITVFVFTVTRGGGSDGAVGATWTIGLPGGVGGADATDVPGSLTGSVEFADGETTQVINVPVQGDTDFEPDEIFTVTLSDPVGGASLGGAVGTGTILNDDPAPAGTLSIDDVTLAEGDGGTTAFTFTVTRSGGSAGTVTVDYATANGTGVAGSDYAATSGTLTFLDGETSQTITVLVSGDTVFEPDETFVVNLTNATGGAVIGDGTGTGTILNDDPVPITVSIADASLAEGNGGITFMTFTVTLSAAAAGAVTVDFATANGTATAGSDYLALSGQVSFAPGETVQTISIPILGDTVVEPNETFTVTLANPTGGAIIDDGAATGTILNDDAAGGPAYYALAGGSFTQDWSNTGLITANDNWSGVPYIVGYLGDIDAGSPTNVDARTLTGPALGAVDVIANLTNANNTSGGVGEFHLANPTIALQGSGTADAPSIVLYMDATGRSGIRLQANLRDIDGTADDAAQQINVQYRTSPGGAWINVPGGYFADVTQGGTATLVTALDVVLPPGADNAATLEIRIMTTNAAGNDEWVGIDDIVVSSQESGPILSIADSAAFEGDSGTTAITFTVTRSGSSVGAATADYAVVFGSGPFAAQANDFAGPLSGQVSFADGQTSATVTLQIQGDLDPEGDDSFFVVLSNPSAGATIGDGTALGTIVNDDGAPPLVSINDVSVTEGDAGTVVMTFTVTRTGGTGAFDIDFTTADGTATAGSDYVAASGTLSFAAGQTTQTVSITVNGDTLEETNETLQVLLSNPTNFALITDGVGIGTIVSDDPLFIHQIQGTSYFSPILAAEGISAFNVASAGLVTVRAIVTAVDNVGQRQGYYLTEEYSDWDGNSWTSEGIFVMTRNDAGVGNVVAGVTVGDLVEISANVMEYQTFSNMPRTVLVNPTGLSVISQGHDLPTITLTGIPNQIMTGVAPDYFDAVGGATFNADLYALSYFESVEGMLVTIPNMVVADGFVSTSGGRPFLQAYSLDSANPEQINDRGGYTIAGDPPFGPPDTPGTGDDTTNGGRALHDGDVNPDIIELDFTDFAVAPPPGLTQLATMGDFLGDVTGIIDFDFTDRKLFVTGIDPSAFVNNLPTQEVTVFGDDSRSLTVATFNVENLDPGDGAARFQALANAIANNLNAPDILCIEEIQDNNGATSSGGADASITWQMLVDALNAVTGKVYQWVDQEPNGAEGGEPGGNIRVGFLYDTGRVQLGDLAADASLAERRQYTDRIGDGVRDAGDLIAFSDDMLGAEINTADWANTRRSLLGEFTFHGNTVYVTANHWPAKGGSGDFWQIDQNPEAGSPANSAWTARNNVAQDVYSMLNLIQQSNPDAGIVAGGDFNDFYFYRPLTTVTGYTMADGTERVGGARFDNLTLTLSEAERYTYTFDGRSQAIDHIIVNNLLSGIATYDIVHINTGYNANGTGADADPSLSDHDPAVASFNFRSLAEVLSGTANADLIEGDGGDDVLRGLAGDDILNGGTGADRMEGGEGNDTYLVDDIGDVVIELAGEGDRDILYTAINYQLSATQYIEVLAAGSAAGTDPLTLIGNHLANEIYGNAGANILVGGGGADQLVGLAGNDIYFVDQSIVQVFEAAGGGTDAIYTSVSYVLGADSSIETLSANSYAATTAINLTGNNEAQTLIGNAGANILHGGGGADILYGREGDDIYYTDVAATQVLEAAGGGNDQLYTSVSYVLNGGSSVELLSTNLHAGTAAINLTGNGFDQLLVGNDGANILHGGGGIDTLYGRAGDDIYYTDVAATRIYEDAGGGNDAVYTSVSFALGAGQEIELLSANLYAATTAINLTGNEFANILYGNDGANVLDGKGGNDILVGLGGADSFRFSTGLGAGNVDSIYGFTHGTDRIELSRAVFANTNFGTLSNSAFHVGSAAHDSSDRIIYNQNTGQLFYDADGNGAGQAVLFAYVIGGGTLTASDFVVI